MEHTEIMGRAKLVLKGQSSAIFIKRKLSDSFDTLPRPVRHVGNESYIKTIWNKMKKNHSEYEKDPVYFDEFIKNIGKPE